MKPLILFFLKYLLAPLLAMLLLFIASALKSVRQKLSMKKVIVFSLIAGLCLGAPALFGFLRNEFVWGGLVLTLVSYLLLGVLFLIALKVMTKDGDKDPNEGMNILLIVVSSVVGGWVYYLVFDWASEGLTYSAWAMAAVLWFTIPYFVYQSFEKFRNIQPPVYALWRCDNGGFNRNYWDTFDSFRARTVKVKVKRRRGDMGYTTLTVRLSDGIPLGNWFDWLIEDQNRRFPQAQIDTKTENPDSGWIFYTSKWFKYPLFIRMLDPNLSAGENRIKKNQVIYIKRVMSINNIQHEED